MMTTSLIIVSLSVFATLFIMYAVDSLVTQVKRRRNNTNTTTTIQIDQVSNNMDMELGHR